jgi:predicted RecB family endonuclease
LPQAQRRLGAALMQAERPAEAAAQLGEAYAACAAAGDADASAVWQSWVEALLAADDPAFITAMAEQTDGRAFAAAMRKFTGHLSELGAQDKHLTVITLVAEALEHLGDRLSGAQRRTLEQMVARSRAKQSALDAQKVAALVPLLGGEDEAAHKASDELVAMSTRAVAPLLAELRKAITTHPAEPKIEAGIVEVLRQVSPRLTGYDPSAPLETRLQLIDTWSAP